MSMGKLGHAATGLIWMLAASSVIAGKIHEGDPEPPPDASAVPPFYRPFFFRTEEEGPGLSPRADVHVRRAIHDQVARPGYLEAAPPRDAGAGRPRRLRHAGRLASSIFGPPTSRARPDSNGHGAGPHIPEPMVFDLVRGLGARRGEFEVNVLSLAPFRRGGPKYEWAPEIEWAIADGFAIEYELPIFDTQIVAQKFAAQYTFGTAFDDAFIHGVQGIAYFDTREREFIPTLLYLAGVRLDETWSLFGMFGGSVGPQIFPFSDEPATTGTDLIVNLSIFADVTERLVLGVETNFSRQLRGPSEFLFMPQVHYRFSERIGGQFGMGMRDDVEGRHGELGFRIVFER